MPRTGREIYDDSVYHIMQKGNNGLRICRDEEDFAMLLRCIKRYLRRFNIEIYHYCAMYTHLHLLLKTLSWEELPKFMQGLLQSYRFYYDKKYDYRGYLYQNRYKSKLVAKDDYLLECGRYIERNPVRAGLVGSPDAYKWSSCIYYTQGKKDDIITTDPLYYDFAKKPKERRQKYTEYISLPRPYEEIIDKEFRI